MPRVGAIAASAASLPPPRHCPTRRRLPTASLAARRASALASPPPRPHAELGTRLLDVRGAPHAPLLPCVSFHIVGFDSPQRNDSTALMMAAANGHEGCVRLLLESKASVNATEVSLERALPQAHVPWTSCPVVIHWPSPQQSDGWAALHWAAAYGHLATAKRLLEGGADLTLRNNGGDTALNCARYQGKSDLVALLSEPRYAPADADRPMHDCQRFPCGGGEARALRRAHSGSNHEQSRAISSTQEHPVAPRRRPTPSSSERALLPLLPLTALPSSRPPFASPRHCMR